MAGSNTMEAVLTAGLRQLGLDTGAVPALARYGELLLEKNQVMNLTAITRPEDVAALHFLDCAALLRYAGREGGSLIDVGTGAGFPGMVLKLLVPDLRVTLLDSLAKRLDWLAETAEALGLTGVTTRHARAEEAGRDPACRERFDFAAARAVAALPVLCELCLPFVRPGGQFLAMKSTGSDEEIRRSGDAIRRLGGRLERVEDYPVPTTDVVHRVVVIRKVSPTPKQYPRRFAQIKKQPL